MQSTTELTPHWRTFFAANRGGGIYSEAVSQRLGAMIALVAYRLRLAPTALTLANLVIGLAASISVLLLANRAADGQLPSWALGLGALVGWQAAYALDCADGQLARVSASATSAGARLDILCDVAAQIGVVAALGAVAVAYRPDTPIWLVAAFVGTWMVNLITSVMQSGPQGASLIASQSLPVRLIKLVRDYGAVILVAGLVLTLVPQWTVVLVWALTVVNGLFLLASIALAARATKPAR